MLELVITKILEFLFDIIFNVYNTRVIWNVHIIIFSLFILFYFF